MPMPNPRRNSYSNSQSTEYPFQIQAQSSSLLSSLIHFLKKPQAFPFLLSALLLLTWISLRLQRPPLHALRNNQTWSPEDDLKANLVRFKSLVSSPIAKDNRGWLLDPISLALNYGVKGGAVTCASVHIGEITPGGVRGNHRHHTCNETFVIWGAKTKFRVEKDEMADQGFAEAIVGKDEVAVAASPRGRAHALVNVDSRRTTFFLGCQDGVVNYNSSTTETDYNIWQDL